MVCRECRSTWRKNAPNHFAKLKIKKKSKSIKGATYYIASWDEAKNLETTEEITELVGSWQIKNRIYICFDFSEVEGLDQNDRSRLVKMSRKLKSISGDLLITNPSQEIFNELWSFNLGFLVAGNQKIKSE